MDYCTNKTESRAYSDTVKARMAVDATMPQGANLLNTWSFYSSVIILSTGL